MGKICHAVIIETSYGCDGNRFSVNGMVDKVVPANIMLTRMEQELCQTGEEHRRKKAASAVAENYGFGVIGTSPALTVSAFTSATDILIQPRREFPSSIETVTASRSIAPPSEKVRRILFTRFDSRANISRQIKELTEQLAVEAQAGRRIRTPALSAYTAKCGVRCPVLWRRRYDCRHSSPTLR